MHTLPKIVVFSSYSTLGDIRNILPKLYESTWLSDSKKGPGLGFKYRILVPHHELSPSFLALWTLHFIFVDYAIPILTCVFRE
jgi:hypothetical protein